ncbi:MAG: hypothetical protein OHK0040_06760 [bacterium]
MARKIKVKKKDELKKPDEFLSFSKKALNYAKENEKKVLIVSVLIIISVLAASFFGYYYKKTDALGYQYLAKALENENDIKAKKEMLLKVKNMSLSSASKYASFYLAQIYDNEKNTELAKVELDKAFAIKDNYFKGAAYILMTDILMKENKLDDALKIIEKTLREVKKPFSEELLYKKAQILEQKNNITEAKKIYNELLKTDSEFYLAKVVQQKIDD